MKEKCRLTIANVPIFAAKFSMMLAKKSVFTETISKQ